MRIGHKHDMKSPVKRFMSPREVHSCPNIARSQYCVT
jgi:hypothetical protein